MNAILLSHLRGDHREPDRACPACRRPVQPKPAWVRRLQSNARSLDAWR